jgi:hypothetical protein
MKPSLYLIKAKKPKLNDKVFICKTSEYISIGGYVAFYALNKFQTLQGAYPNGSNGIKFSELFRKRVEGHGPDIKKLVEPSENDVEFKTKPFLLPSRPLGVHLLNAPINSR